MAEQPGKGGMSMKPRQKQIGRVAAAVRGWLGISFDLTNEEAWSSVGGGYSVAGVSVNAGTAMQVSAVWACVRLISETIATLPLSLYEKTSAGKMQATRHPLHFVVHDQPNIDSTAAVFWEAFVASMLLRGVGRAEKLMSAGQVIGLLFLNPDRLSTSKDSKGNKEYRYTENGRQRVISRSRIWEVPGFTLDGECGVSVIQYGAKVFGNAIAADQAASKTFTNGMLQTVFYKVAAFLNKTQRDEFRRNVMGTIERGETPLLEGGTDAGTIGINPSDAQLLESRGFSVQEVCRWFRVPPWMVGHTEKSTSWGSGIESQMIGFLTFTLAPWLRRIEQAIRKDLLTPAEGQRYYAKFSVEGLLRADSAARAAFYSVMVNNGILTRDEVRELEDREAMGGNAAVLTVQSAMVPLDALGTTDTQATQARSAMRALLGLDDQPPSQG